MKLSEKLKQEKNKGTPLSVKIKSIIFALFVVVVAIVAYAVKYSFLLLQVAVCTYLYIELSNQYNNVIAVGAVTVVILLCAIIDSIRKVRKSE